MFAATAYKTLSYVKTEGMFTSSQFITLGIGNAVAFIVALLAIKFFVAFVKNKGFRLFGYYRIALGIVVLLIFFFKK